MHGLQDTSGKNLKFSHRFVQYPNLIYYNSVNSTLRTAELLISAADCRIFAKIDVGARFVRLESSAMVKINSFI